MRAGLGVVSVVVPGDVPGPATGMSSRPRVGPRADRVRAAPERCHDLEALMPSWLLILIVGVVLLVLGVAVEAAKFLIWLGIAVLVVSLILGLLGRGRRARV